LLKDSLGRQIADLRLSVTDRCNFKCSYCKTARGVHAVSRSELLTYEEMERLARLFVGLGIRKIRVTGGEPLLRRNLEALIERLAAIPELVDLALTTNGFNLYEKAPALKAAGLGRVTVSLDSLRPDRFFEITRSSDFPKVLRSIEAAKEWGFEPVKVNCVLVRGFNEDEIPDFAEFARTRDLSVRFIEFMPLDEDEKWSRELVVTGDEVLGRLRSSYQLIPAVSHGPSETAVRYRFADTPGEVGLINPVSRPFCGECSRIRLTADGKIRTCLFSMEEHDVRRLLRDGSGDEDLVEFIRSTVLFKEPGHRINEPGFVPPPRTMSYIGG
jgi:GTP 3',8-cyclase